MKVISFKSFKEVPGCVKVMWAIALTLVVAGGVTLALDMAGIVSIKLCVSLALIVAAQMINVFGIRKYKDVLYKEV